jgi:sugar O-acyltransferase (sialic acid O-acetyltransferase NeuD family)
MGTKKRDLILWGGTGLAEELKELTDELGFNITAIFDNNDNLQSSFDNIPLYHGKQGFEKWLSKRKEDKKLYFLVAVSGDKGEDRINLNEYLKSFKLEPITVVSPQARTSNTAAIGESVQIYSGSRVGPHATIGKSCIIMSGAMLAHGCNLEDGVFIGQGANIAGLVNIGYCATIWTGAIILPRLHIGEGAVVGAGAVVLNDVPPHTVVAGNPARIIKKTDKA